MFNKYYQDELGYLKDLGREFAREYPAIAPVLGDAGGDPDVERLLEGVAFLTGRIRQKLDDDIPEFIHHIARMLFPHLLRPIPAATILELMPLKQALRDRRTVPAGTEFDSVPIEGIATRFCTTTPCEVVPWTLERPRFESSGGMGQSVVFDLVLFPGITISQVRPSQVRLFLSGDSRSSLSLLSGILTQVRKIRLRAGNPGQTEGCELDPSFLHHVGFEDEDSLLPECEAVLPGLRLAEEYFCFPQKFAFLEIRGLERFADHVPTATSISISLDLDRPISGLQYLQPDSIRLHCVPMVNVFRTTAEPIRIQGDRECYTVHPAGLAAGQGTVYSLGEVMGIERATGRRHTIAPFFEYATATSGVGNQLVYVQHLEPSVLGNGAELSISIESSSESGTRSTVDVLSIDMLATHGRLASQVRAGDVSVATPSSPAYASFRNLTAATQYVPVPLGRELQWRAIAHASMGLRSLLEPNVLRTMLSVYNLIGLVDRQAERANELRIQAVREIRVQPFEHLYRGSSVRGISVDLDLDETGFAGDGDLYLFGSVLDRLFASYVPLNSLANTAVHGIQSHVRYAWPARSGSIALI